MAIPFPEVICPKCGQVFSGNPIRISDTCGECLIRIYEERREEAEQDASSAAVNATRSYTGSYDHNHAATVLRDAEMQVMRDLVSANLSDKEVTYWQLVAEEVKK